MVYTITDSVYTFRFFRLFGFTITLNRLIKRVSQKAPSDFL